MTPIQKKLYDFLLPRAADLVQPTISEMVAHLGLKPKSRSGVHRMLNSLKDLGLVEKLPTNDRCWRALPVDLFAGRTDQQLADELRRRGYRVDASKSVPRHPDSGWTGPQLKVL